MARRVASGCLVFHEGNCLLLRRSALEDTMQGLWEMPAGKIESDRDGSPEENAIRETLEEAGIALGDVVPLGEHLTDSKRFYGFLGVSDTANVELSFEHDAYVWMSTPDILTAVAADEMMVGHHTVYFLQQLLDDAEGFIYEAESSEENFACTDYIIEEIKRIWYSPAQKDIKHWVEHTMAGDGLLAYSDGFDLPDGSEGLDITKDEYFERMFESFLERFEKGSWMYSDDDHGIMIQGDRVLYVPVGTPVNLDSLGNWENRKGDQYGVYGDKITSWLWTPEIYAGVIFGHDDINHMIGEEGIDFDRIHLTVWVPWEAIDWASTIAFNISSHWQENELCIMDKEPVYELNFSRNEADEASLDKAMNAESGDVRINYNANCPACISIMSLIGEEKLETDPANTYWGGGAYQKEVEHLQDGTWDFGDGQGSVQLHEPLLVGGIHHNLLGRAGTLLHDYNNNGNGNILEMGDDEECYECDGTGEYDCWSDCDDGKQECYTCDGTGEVEDDEGEDEVCDDCDGSGEQDCSSCDGQTYCEQCGGDGDFWNEEIVRGINNWYQTNVIDYIYAHGNSDIRYALDRLVEGLESGQLRTTYSQEMYNEANHKLYNDLHDAIVYYVINTPNKPLPEGESHDAETFAADSCRECGRKEGPYADTVLIACPGCPELTCQHCYVEDAKGCVFCIKKRAETVSDDVPSDYYNNTPMVIQDLLTQSGGDCDKCGENVPNGKGHYPKADKELGDDDDTRICLPCFEADPNFSIYNEAETFSAEKITKDELIEYLDWLEEGEHYVFDTSPRAVRFRELLAGELQINSADVDFMDKDEFILLGAEEIPMGVAVKSFKTTSKIYYNRKLVKQFYGPRHREKADSIAGYYARKVQKNPNYFNYLRYEAEEYTEDSTFDTDVAIAQSLFALVTIRDLLMQNMTDEALEFINGEYLPEERVDEIIDDDLRAEVQAFIDSKSPERFESESFNYPQGGIYETNMSRQNMSQLSRRDYLKMIRAGHQPVDIRMVYDRLMCSHDSCDQNDVWTFDEYEDGSTFSVDIQWICPSCGALGEVSDFDFDSYDEFWGTDPELYPVTWYTKRGRQPKWTPEEIEIVNLMPVPRDMTSRAESLTGKDMSYCKCGTKDEVGGFTCGQHCSRISKKSESTSKPARVEIKRATIDPYKLTAVFYDKDDKKIKTTHFGDERYEDYTIHKDKERLKNYNTRHGSKKSGEKWQQPMTAGALSKWILWNKPSLKASFDDYKRRFKLKGDLKAKTSGGRKRAEETF